MDSRERPDLPRPVRHSPDELPRFGRQGGDRCSTINQAPRNTEGRTRMATIVVQRVYATMGSLASVTLKLDGENSFDAVRQDYRLFFFG